MISHDELKKHISKDDCWVILHSKVYDVTSFVHEHPGGSAGAHFRHHEERIRIPADPEKSF